MSKRLRNDHIHTRVNKTTKQEFSRACRKAGHSQSDVLNWFMKRFTTGGIKCPKTLEI